tara:strand:- start:1527 stop:1952 length:426 start_codon:yes stop_codon:yes gene_type:complete
VSIVTQASRKQKKDEGEQTSVTTTGMPSVGACGLSFQSLFASSLIFNEKGTMIGGEWNEMVDFLLSAAMPFTPEVILYCQFSSWWSVLVYSAWYDCSVTAISLNIHDSLFYLNSGNVSVCARVSLHEYAYRSEQSPRHLPG